MSKWKPDYVILSGGGDIARLNAEQLTDADRVVEWFLEELTRKAEDGR